MIPFNVPVNFFDEKVVNQLKENNKFSGDGYFSNLCQSWFEEFLGVKRTLLTTSCTDALELVAILLNIQEGDEVIMPSYTFVSTANAFVLRGAKIVFVDIRPDTMNINEELIEQAISSKTKVIVPVHYGGVACEMDKIMELAFKYNLYVVEDAAQGMMSEYKGKKLGTIGHLGTYSFHETKNYNSGEGGLLIINDEQFIERAEILREKGTNRSKYFRGEVDKYSWVDIGSSFLMSDINAAFLYPQLLRVQEINENRLRLLKYYRELFQTLKLEMQFIPEYCKANAHLFYIKLPSQEIQSQLIQYLLKEDIHCSSHYVPLHSSVAGKKFGVFYGQDKFTTFDSERLLRLPLYYGLTVEQVRTIFYIVRQFTKENATYKGESK